MEEPAELDLDEDIEENLLRPMGVEPEAVDLIVKVFSAMDMPQTDPSLKTGLKFFDRLTRQEGKDLCDPYIKVSFGGRKVTTSVVDDNYDPEYYEDLHLATMLPSMCDRIKLQVC